jgi:hypothetical protein
METVPVIVAEAAEVAAQRLVWLVTSQRDPRTRAILGLYGPSSCGGLVLSLIRPSALKCVTIPYQSYRCPQHYLCSMHGSAALAYLAKVLLRSE